MRILLEDGTIVEAGGQYVGYILIDDKRIKTVGIGKPDDEIRKSASRIIYLSGSYVLPGIIDDQVHFRQPGGEAKADIYSESRAAAAGGVTSFMDMPNTNPQTVTISAWNDKMETASHNSIINYSFFFGATNSNISEIHSIDKKLTPGVKVFMGSSTGGMLVDDKYALSSIFAESDMLVAIHSEDEKIIKANLEKARNKFGDEIPFEYHPLIRSSEACVRSTERAMELALKYGTRLHVLHVSTREEVSLLGSSSTISEKQFTSEACIPHIHFTDADYSRLGSRIKCNPSIKSSEDRQSIRDALLCGKMDIVATDHAPHLLSEKQRPYVSSPSGMPMIQHSLPVMLTDGFSLQEVVRLMANNVSDLYHIKERGYIREGYYADITVVDKKDWVVSKDNILYKCGWSPIEDLHLKWKVRLTIVNGHIVYDSGVLSDHTGSCMALEYL